MLKLFLVTPSDNCGGSDHDTLVHAINAESACVMVDRSLGGAHQFDPDPTAALGESWLARELPDLSGVEHGGIVEWSRCTFTFWRAVRP